MFDLFRSRAKAVRYLLGAMLLLVALSMVVTLIPGFNSGMQTDSQVVAEVGKQALTLQELQQNVQAQIQGRQFPTEMAPILVPQIANQMITEYAVAYQAERMGFQVTEADMATAIHNILPQLFNGDQFAGRDVYAAALAQQNMTIPQFESALRMQLQMSALVGLAQRGVVVTPKEVAALYGRGRVLGILLCQLGEVPALLELLQQIVRLGRELRQLVLGLVHRLEQDVADVDAFRHSVGVLVLLVDLAQFFIGENQRLGQFGLVHDQDFERAFLGKLIAGAVPLIERLQLLRLDADLGAVFRR